MDADKHGITFSSSSSSSMTFRLRERGRERGGSGFVDGKAADDYVAGDWNEYPDKMGRMDPPVRRVARRVRRRAVAGCPGADAAGRGRDGIKPDQLRAAGAGRLSIKQRGEGAHLHAGRDGRAVF